VNLTSTHQDLQDMLPAAALDILDESDAQRLREHLAHCEECTRILSEYGEVAATLPLLLPEQSLDAARSEALRGRLLSRISAGQHSRNVVRSNPRHSRESGSRAGPERWTGWMGWMVAAGLAGLLLVHHSVHRPLDYGWLAAGVLTLLVLALGVYALRQRARLTALRNRLAQAAEDNRGAQADR
jgi:anti-sigma factor RsiW